MASCSGATRKERNAARVISKQDPEGTGYLGAARRCAASTGNKHCLFETLCVATMFAARVTAGKPVQLRR